MPTKYCDQSASNGYPAYNSTPTWGVPFDGDGVGLAKSTASATLSINLSGITATAASSTINIAGLSFSCVDSGGGGGAATFTAGAGATLATNLAAAINACTSLLPNAVASGWLTNNPCKDVLYARVTSATTLELMTFAGSASYNANANFQLAVANMSGLAGPYQFSGGASGCWAYVLNETNSFLRSGRSFWTYGIWGNSYMLAGAINPGDEVAIRSNKSITQPSNGGASQAFRQLGTAAMPVTFTIDNGTVWTADAGSNTRLVLSWNFDANYRGGTVFHNNSLTSYIRVVGKRYSDDTSNCVSQIGTQGGNLIITSSFCQMENLDFFGNFVNANTSTVTTAAVSNMSNSFKGRMYRCRLYSVQSTSFINPTSYAYSATSHEFVECGFYNGGTAYAQGNAVKAASSANNGVINAGNTDGRYEVAFDNCTFGGFAANSFLFINYPTSYVNLKFRNCNFGNVSLIKPVLGASNYYIYSGIFGYSSFNKADYFCDTPEGFEEWNSSRSFPVCNALLFDGSPWSIHVIPPTTANNTNYSNPFETRRFGKKNTLANGARTFRCEVAISDQLTWTAKDIALVVEYVATDGTLVTQTSYDPTGAALTASATAWSAYSGGSGEAGGKVVYPYDSTLHNKYCLTVGTVAGKPMALGTQMSAWVRVFNTVANNTIGLFVDPEIVVT